MVWRLERHSSRYLLPRPSSGMALIDHVRTMIGNSGLVSSFGVAGHGSAGGHYGTESVGRRIQAGDPNAGAMQEVQSRGRWRASPGYSSGQLGRHGRSCCSSSLFRYTGCRCRFGTSRPPIRAKGIASHSTSARRMNQVFVEGGTVREGVFLANSGSA